MKNKNDITNTDINSKATKVLKKDKVAVFIVAYNAEKKIESVLNRIPEEIAKGLEEIFVIDDSSTDKTFTKLNKTALPNFFPPFNIYKTPYNLGYGGNQKMGYKYTIKKGFDIVILLHGDGQYAPECLSNIIAQYDIKGESIGAVFGSRFSQGGHPLKGGMPMYKYIGNKILTFIQNTITGTDLSELHCGYRSYRCESLKKIPFEYNSNGFHFDSEIILQLKSAGLKIKEVAIPTYYGDEICHVNGIKYAWNCIKTSVKYRLMQEEIFYDPKYDIRDKNSTIYKPKYAETSLHHHIRNLKLPEGLRIADIGGADGEAISKYFCEKNDVSCVDYSETPSPKTDKIKKIDQDLNDDWDFYNGTEFDIVFALDIIEHLTSPEKATRQIFKILKSGGTLYASTGNISFFITRFMLFFGKFNYGRKGILDLTHTRLMTINSFRRLLENAGFKVVKKKGFGPPLKDLHPDSVFFAFIDKLFSILAKLWPGMFAFSILMICERPDSIEELTGKTFKKNTGT